MFGLGVPELLFIMVLALLVFGPKKLPEVGRMIGRGMGEFRRASTDLQRTLNTELSLDEPAPERPRRPVAVEDPPPPQIRAVPGAEARRNADPE